MAVCLFLVSSLFLEVFFSSMTTTLNARSCSRSLCKRISLSLSLSLSTSNTNNKQQTNRSGTVSCEKTIPSGCLTGFNVTCPTNMTARYHQVDSTSVHPTNDTSWMLGCTDVEFGVRCLPQVDTSQFHLFADGDSNDKTTSMELLRYMQHGHRLNFDNWFVLFFLVTIVIKIFTVFLVTRYFYCVPKKDRGKICNCCYCGGGEKKSGDGDGDGKRRELSEVSSEISSSTSSFNKIDRLSRRAKLRSGSFGLELTSGAKSNLEKKISVAENATDATDATDAADATDATDEKKKRSKKKRKRRSLVWTKSARDLYREELDKEMNNWTSKLRARDIQIMLRMVHLMQTKKTKKSGDEDVDEIEIARAVLGTGGIVDMDVSKNLSEALARDAVPDTTMHITNPFFKPSGAEKVR